MFTRRLSRRIKSACLENWGEVDVDLIGSFPLGIYLTESDIDLVIHVQSTHKREHVLKVIFFALSSYQRYRDLLIICSKNVPILKLSTEEELHFDIAINNTDGRDQLKEYRKVISENPEIPCLLLLLKRFLRHRNLNNPAVGGIGSFLLFCLIHLFVANIRLETPTFRDNLKTKMVKITAADYSLGSMMLGFCEFFSKVFDPHSQKVVICKDGPPKIMKKNPFDYQQAQNGLLVILERDSQQRNVAKPLYLATYQRFVAYLQVLYEHYEPGLIALFLGNPIITN